MLYLRVVLQILVYTRALVSSRPVRFLPERDYATFGNFGYLLSQSRLSVVCWLSVCNVRAPYSLS